MVVNDYLSWRRRLVRTSPRADVEPDPGGLSDGADERAERNAMIRRLAGLPRKQRVAVALRYYAGLPDAEIATQLGCRETTAPARPSHRRSAARPSSAR